nr:MAG TPA: hypothetical protein [Caudoviricetes sp.]
MISTFFSPLFLFGFQCAAIYYPAFRGPFSLCSSIICRSYNASILLQMIIWLISSRSLSCSVVLFMSIFKSSVNSILLTSLFLTWFKYITT